MEAFGVMIGNTDRHDGNISLLTEGGAWRLAPAAHRSGIARLNCRT